MAQVVYARAAANSDIRGDLFGGLKFFIAQRCPSRATYVDKVISNGGLLVKLETQADLLIADDIARKTHLNPAGAISYRFIDDSVRRGTLADAEDEKYKAGPIAGTVRPVSSIQPGKYGRTPFTLEDKIQLYEFVQPYAENGGSVRGNEIYKQLERVNPRHTFQAWRDHYIKQLEGRPHPGGDKPSVRPTAPPTPPIDQQPEVHLADDVEAPHEGPQPARAPPMTTKEVRRHRRIAVQAPKEQPVSITRGFTADDIHDLLLNADHILDTRVRHEAAAWQAWVDCCYESNDHDTPRFSADEWKSFWQGVVRPIYEEYADNQRRRKIYLTAWLAWADMNPKATSDHWLEYFDLVVKQLMQGNEGGEGGTPVKKHSTRMFGVQQRSPLTQNDTLQAQEGRELQAKRPHTTTEAENGYGQVSHKRHRLMPRQATREATSLKAAVQEDVAVDDAEPSVRAFVNVPEDDAQVEGNESGVSSSKPPRTTYIPASSPPDPASSRSRGAAAADNTQAILQQTQEFDFDVPEPEGGFDPEVLYPDLRSHESPLADPTGVELAMIAAKAEHDAIDADIAIAESTAYQNEPAEPALARLTPIETGYQPLEERAAMLNIEALIQSGRDPSLIQEAALRTSADPALFRIVLRSLELGKGVPQRTRGVWTDEDEGVLLGTDARALRRLERKHGNTGLHSLDGRIEFLNEWTNS